MIKVDFSINECQELVKVLSEYEGDNFVFIIDKLNTELRLLGESLSPISYTRLRVNGLSKEVIQLEYLIDDIELKMLEMCYGEYLKLNKK